MKNPACRLGAQPAQCVARVDRRGSLDDRFELKHLTGYTAVGTLRGGTVERVSLRSRASVSLRLFGFAAQGQDGGHILLVAASMPSVDRTRFFHYDREESALHDALAEGLEAGALFSGASRPVLD